MKKAAGILISENDVKNVGLSRYKICNKLTLSAITSLATILPSLHYNLSMTYIVRSEL